AILYTTYLGGSSDDAGNSIAVDSSLRACITGHTNSTNFPTSNAAQQALNALDDAFVAKLNSAGNGFVYSTYLGGSADDIGRGVATDSAGNVYVTGVTNSTDFTTLNALQASSGGLEDAFVTKFNTSGALVYSTYLGGSGYDKGAGIAVDSS